MVKLHFDDCPYNCNNNGKLFNEELREFVDCPYCSKKRKELLKMNCVETIDGDTKSLSRILGIESDFLSTKFVYEAVIPEGECLFIEQDSLDNQKANMEEIYLGLSVGELPERSYCFGLGNKGRIDTFAYPLLAKAYLSGLKVGKFISCGEFNSLCVAMDESVKDYYQADFLIMLLPEGCTYADIAAAKGLMQTRALKGKATIFVTTWTIEACSALVGYYEDESLFMARGIFVHYKSSKKKHSNYINKLLGVENGQHSVQDANLSYEQEEEIGYSVSSVASSEKGKTYTTIKELLK